MAARNADPPLPGSARATLRTPEAADELKEQVRKLHSDMACIERLQRDIARAFYEVGLVLIEIRDARLYGAKGYSNFESFVDREVGLGRVRAFQLVRIVETFKRESAISIGLDGLLLALRSIDESSGHRPARPLEPPSGSVAKSSRR